MAVAAAGLRLDAGLRRRAQGGALTDAQARLVIGARAAPTAAAARLASLASRLAGTSGDRAARRLLHALLRFQLRHQLRRHVPQLMLTMCVRAAFSIGAGA